MGPDTDMPAGTRLGGLQALLLGLDPALFERVAASVLVVVGLWLMRRFVLAAAFRTLTEQRTRYRWRKGSAALFVSLGVIIVGRIWFEAMGSLATALALVSAGLAIALKDPLTNIAGWVFIIWRRPFTVGDRIQVGDVKGDVIDIRLFQFTLLELGNWVDADQSTGRLVHVPNAVVFASPQFNYTQGFEYVWNEIAVLITFESDWRKAKLLLTEIAARHAEPASGEAAEQVRRAAERYLIRYPTLTPTVYTSVRDSGVLLTVRHLAKPRERRGISQAIWEEILDTFARHRDIDFAYPTQRFYDNRAEGKTAAVGDRHDAESG